MAYNKFVSALLKSGVDNPKLNEMAMNMLLQDMTGGSEDSSDQAIREAIASRMLQEEQPDYAKVKNILKSSTNLDDLLGTTDSTDTVSANELQLEVQRLINEGRNEEAAQLSALSPAQYKQYKGYTPETSSFLTAAGKTGKGLGLKDVGIGLLGAAVPGVGLYNLYSKATKPSQLQGEEYTKKKKEYLNQLLSE